MGEQIKKPRTERKLPMRGFLYAEMPYFCKKYRYEDDQHPT